MSELYHVIVKVVTPGYEPATLTTPSEWADALHRRHVEIVTAQPQAEPDLPPGAFLRAPAGILSPVAQPMPGTVYTVTDVLERVRDDEAEVDRLGEALCDTRAAVEEMRARLDALDGKWEATHARLRALEEAAERMEGDNR